MYSLVASDLIRIVVQPNELAINVKLIDAHIASGRGWMGDADTAAGLRLLHVHTLSFATCSTNTAAGRGSRHGHARWRAGRKL